VLAGIGVGILLSTMLLAGCSRTPVASGAVPTSASPHTTAVHSWSTGATKATSFPSAVSANGRYLVDGKGRPFMMVGDSPQCLSANLSPGDMDFFFSDRAAHGFNTAWVNLLCGSYTGGADDGSTFHGLPPFTDFDDLSTPNPAYFAVMDTMVQLAADHGITLLLDPAETGSFRNMLKSNGVEKTKAYGLYLGERYGDAPNIIWMLGNDYQTDQWKTYDPYLTALAEGIREAAPDDLKTIELNYNVSTSFDDPTWTPLVELASAYSYQPTYDAVLRAYDATPIKPVFMVEANYEFENNTRGPNTTDETLRRQEYWTMLSGATGQLYGNGYTWRLNDRRWKQHFDTPAVNQVGLMATLFRSLPWQDLVPDQDHTILTDGFGSYDRGGDVLDNAYATAAATADGSLAVVYVPTARTIQLDRSRLKPGLVAEWFDPTNGERRPASQPFTTPGKNSAGDPDWVLIAKTSTSLTHLRRNQMSGRTTDQPS
jgi:hypothetical protein